MFDYCVDSYIQADQTSCLDRLIAIIVEKQTSQHDKIREERKSKQETFNNIFKFSVTFY